MLLIAQSSEPSPEKSRTKLSLTYWATTHYSSIGIDVLYTHINYHAFMADQLPRILYTKELIRKGCGYPFWYPEPDSSAPEEFKKRGVFPGDVSIINNDRGFDFLFSIFSGADGLIIGHSPPGFHPLPQSIQGDVQRHPLHGKLLTSQHMSLLKAYKDAGMSFDVDISEASAAILCLPNYSTGYRALNKRIFEGHARRHGVSWYRYVNGTLGRNAPNGSLYLITRCNKATTWGNTVIGRTDRSISFSLRCTLMNISGGSIQVANSWLDDSGIETSYFPIPSVQYPYPTDLENQCIFAQGFTISISKNPIRKSWQVIPHPINGSSTDRIPSFDPKNAPLPPSDGKIRWMGGLSSSSSKTLPKDADFDQRRMLAESTDQESLVAEVSEFPIVEGELLNPSAAMNTYLLSKDPSLEIAITHDEAWMEVYKDTDSTEQELWSKLNDSLDAKISMQSDDVGMWTVIPQCEASSFIMDVSTSSDNTQAEMELMSTRIRELEKLEMELAKRYRMVDGEEIDSVEVFNNARFGALSDPQSMLDAEQMDEL
ncbi:hypothetical protein EDD18DRAFT_1333885, partial [Armillaria luteobubalina]